MCSTPNMVNQSNLFLCKGTVFPLDCGSASAYLTDLVWKFRLLMCRIVFSLADIASARRSLSAFIMSSQRLLYALIALLLWCD